MKSFPTPSWSTSQRGDPPAELAEIEAPFLLVTTSSEFQDDTRLAQVALEALTEEPCHVVATLPTMSCNGGPPG